MDIRDTSDQALVAELERRGFFSRLAGLIPKPGMAVAFAGPDNPGVASTSDPLPTKPMMIPGTDRRAPAGTTSVMAVPGRTQKDGKPLMLVSVGEPRPTPEAPLVNQFIVRGDDREALANSFIQQWRDEITTLETRLEQEKLPQDEIDAIWSDITRLQGQIARRSASAFGAMGIEEVKARNVANGGTVLDAPALPGDPTKGIQVPVVLGISAFDDPALTVVYLNDDDTGGIAKAIEPVIRWDPFVLHLPQPTFRSTGTRAVEILREPVVIWRALLHTQEALKRLRLGFHGHALMDTLVAAGDFGLDFPKPGLGHADPAAAYAKAWTDFLIKRLREAQDETTFRSIKRTIRIFNVDFREQEAPDFMFEEGTDGERPLGAEHRPHVDPRAAWTEVEQGPGVFRMSRQPKTTQEDL